MREYADLANQSLEVLKKAYQLAAEYKDDERTDEELLEGNQHLNINNPVYGIMEILNEAVQLKLGIEIASTGQLLQVLSILGASRKYGVGAEMADHGPPETELAVLVMKLEVGHMLSPEQWFWLVAGNFTSTTLPEDGNPTDPALSR